MWSPRPKRKRLGYHATDVEPLSNEIPLSTGLSTFPKLTDMGGATSSASVTPNPSILYVVLEDFSTLASPVFSADATAANRRHTPYLASLAARGVVFQNA